MLDDLSYQASIFRLGAFVLVSYSVLWLRAVILTESSLLRCSQRSERKDILIEQFDDEDGNHDRTTEIVFDARSAFRQDPTTPVTPLPGTPLIFDEIVSWAYILETRI